MQGETLITIVAIFLAAILIGIFPMMAIADRNDDVAQLAVTTGLSEFVNTVRTTGKITIQDYDALVNSLYSTGNTYNVYPLKEGDILTVTASNNNLTIAQMLKNFFYSLAGNNTYSIVGSQSGVIAVSGS